MAELKSFTEGRHPITFVDLFAGAGGISEGFMQAYTDDKYYDFVLASDINDNCELTHRVRYNRPFNHYLYSEFCLAFKVFKHLFVFLIYDESREESK